MKSTSRRRLALAAGLLILALLVSAIVAQVAFAINDVGTGSGGGATVIALPAPSPGVAAAPATQPQQGSMMSAQAGFTSALAAAPSSTQSASSGSTTWIAIVISIVALVGGVVAWVSINNRRRPAASSLAAFCVQHPEDSLCGAA